MLLLFWKGQAALEAGIDCTEAPDVCAVAGGEVAAKAYPPPAGASRRRKRRRVVIEGRAYWVTDSELPQLLYDTLRRPPLPMKARTRPIAAPVVASTVADEPRDEIGSSDRWEAVRALFHVEHDAAALAALERARRMAEEEEEREVELLLLAA